MPAKGWRKRQIMENADYKRGFDYGFILRKEKDGKREWVGLTDEERDHLEGLHLYAARNQVEAWIEGVPSFIDAIEAKLKEKNT